MTKNLRLGKRKVVISGSFRKHYEDILRSIESFEKDGWLVLSPAKSRIIKFKDDFAVLESDHDLSALEIEQKHLDAISMADALYVVNPDGYIGISTSIEIGWAFHCKVPVFLRSKTPETLVGGFCLSCKTPRQVEETLSGVEQSHVKRILHNSSIPDLQEYVSNVVAKRGFGDETTRDILLLLVEEIGELAKAIRETIGLKVDVSDVLDRRIADELADVLIYLLDLANTCSIDLIDVLIAKEVKNEQRSWVAKK